MFVKQPFCPPFILFVKLGPIGTTEEKELHCGTVQEEDANMMDMSTNKTDITDFASLNRLGSEPGLNKLLSWSDGSNLFDGDLTTHQG